MPKLLPKHILSQIEFRLEVADKECMENGECRMCGCKTPYLFYTNRSCDKPCYPTIVSKEKWWKFKAGGILTDSFENKWVISPFYRLPFKIHIQNIPKHKNILYFMLHYLYNFKRN
jgi:hypothetical protein